MATINITPELVAESVRLMNRQTMDPFLMELAKAIVLAEGPDIEEPQPSSPHVCDTGCGDGCGDGYDVDPPFTPPEPPKMPTLGAMRATVLDSQLAEVRDGISRTAAVVSAMASAREHGIGEVAAVALREMNAGTVRMVELLARERELMDAIKASAEKAAKGEG